MNVKPLKNRSGWYNLSLSGDASEEQLESLRAIPGIHLGKYGLEGRIDAIAAACKVVGEPVPMADHGRVRHEVEGLRDYQQLGVGFLNTALRTVGGAILADDMGLGKTLQSLTAMRLLTENRERVLILAPAAALETWRDELAKWKFDSFEVLTSSALKSAKQAWERSPAARIVVTSHDHRLIERAVEQAFVKPGHYPRMLIIDEAHRFRGRGTRRSDILSDIAPMVEYKLALTGTPQLNRPRDWWQLLHILFGKRFGSRFNFDLRYCGAKHNGYGWENKGATHLDELKLRLSYYMLRREKKDVAQELPPLVRQIRWVDSTAEARRATERYRLGLDDGTRQVALEAVLKGKAEEAMALAQEAGRFLLFTWMKGDARYFQRELNDRGVPCALITGDMAVEKRAEHIRQARANGWGVVATLDSTAESLNLQGMADVGIMHSIDATPMKMAQGEGRLHRLGTVNPITWYYLAMRDTIDVDLVRLVVSKLDAWVKVMGEGKKGMLEAFDAFSDGATEGVEADILKRLYEEMADG